MHEDVSGALTGCIASLRRYAMALCRNPDEADDLVQETLKRALVYIRDGRQIRDLRAYLFTVLHNVRVDDAMRASRNGHAIPIEAVADELSSAAGQHARHEFRDFTRALHRLPDEQRTVVLLVGLEGLSYRAVSQVLGIPAGTVMSRLCRGRRALRRLMDGDNPVIDARHAGEAPLPAVQDNA
ncbi:MAG: sigma-70 family RNA polymerase sigma factor [Alphaproteobacteria bacterium]